MKEKIILFLIVAVASFLRFFNVTNIPPSLSHDEVAIGYNAYSILKTGKDEYGAAFPLLFRSFDDYKLPGMVYFTVPSIAVFGLNELGVRFPSVFLGVLSVIFFYFIVKELTREKKKEYFPLIITAFFALSIWHINFSRQLFESNGAVFFLLLGTYFLILFKKNPTYIIVSAFFYAVSLYFYYSVRLVLPFLLLTFIIISKHEVFKNIKILSLAFFVGFLVLIPLLPSLFSKAGFERINIVSVLNDPAYIDRKEIFTDKIAENNTFISRIVYNRRVAFIITVAENYVKNISPKHIFFTGTTSAGLLYPIEAPFFFLGIYFLLRLKTSLKWLVLTWFLSAPLAGAFTVDQPNPLRTLVNAPMLSLFSGFGFASVLKILKNNLTKKIFIIFTIIGFCFFFYSFWVNYFIKNPAKNALRFGDGYKQMTQYLIQNEHKFDKIYISGYYWRPYIFVLFYKKYDPLKYQSKGTIEHFDKYYFSRAEWDEKGMYFNYEGLSFQPLKKSKDEKILMILSKQEFQKHGYQLINHVIIDGIFAKNVFTAGEIP